MEIIQKTSTVHTSVYANRPLEFLAIHYTAGGSSRKGTARNVASMFGSPSSRAASADFIVDDYECVQFNPDIRNRYTYAVGGGLQGNPGGGKFYGKCKNYNSISIEICSSNTNGNLKYPNTSNWYFTDAAIKNAIELARYLMEKYNIPKDHLIRHYDVNQKLCPGIIGWNKESGSEAKWLDFKNSVLNGSVAKKEDELDMTKAEFLNSLTNEEAYNLLAKANAYIGELPEANWSVTEGWWKQATDNNVVDGTRPCSFITRQESIAVLGRLLGELKKK